MFWYWKKKKIPSKHLLYRLWQRINIEMLAEISHLISGLLLTIRKRHFQLYSMRYESVSYLDLFWKEVIFLFRKGTINRVFRSMLIPKSVRLSVCVVLDCITIVTERTLCVVFTFCPSGNEPRVPRYACVCVFPQSVSLKSASVAPRQTNHPSRGGRGCVCAFERGGLT